ncbi:TonB-dependent receptor [Asticcacaulis sp. BYS171W]|uniref:TonB-dependent receptor n=1 Tax=Asticcacaulis aquaticus TaxID=2984212 RepID=A0ABT5HYK8_9CAUL|nr:TonB-dependent receptor [Asticcacaulis aquaticus]MDC7685138.1 TonB-dependent receptor [Asticcacaulis aquaticus]
MHKSPKGAFARYLMTGTGLAMLAVSAPAFAQQAPVAAKGDEVTEVIIVGTRASQQSAIDRKKKAKTATDSIVAEDVGSFPDRNLNEAISRIAGMSVNRGEGGEGEGLTLRGNGPDLTRVEMDGMSVNSSGFDLAVNGGNGGGRGSDLRELPADLIKSVDVVKGQTPDQTEGGLGGTVQIKTRSGLDFKKPYLSMRVGLDQNSLSQKWSPDVNIVASRKFFDNRLGVIFNVTKTRRLNDSHQLNVAGTNNAYGYLRAFDFDNSPNKTFSFDPSLANGAGANDPVATWDLTAGGKFNSLTPVEILTRSAAAKTKAECLTQFPLYTDAQLNTIVAGTSNANRAAAQSQRIQEQITCMNQWNDYAPNLVRDKNLTQYEDRLNWDIRFDYKVNDHLSVYVKYQVADRLQTEDNRQRTRGSINAYYAGVTGITTQNLVSNTNIATGTPVVLTPVAGNGYYIYNAGTPTKAATLDQTLAGSVVNMAFPVNGVALNIVPTSIVMDSNHHLTQFDLTNASYGVDHIHNEQIWKNNYVLAGGTYKDGPLLVEFQGSKSEATYTRYDKRMSRSTNYGTATMKVLPSGIWDFVLPSNFDFNDMNNYVQLNAASAVGMPQYTGGITLQYNPRLVETTENAAKIDATYSMNDFPILKRFKAGVSYRQVLNDYWGAGGFSPKPNVFVPTLAGRSSVRACENISTTTAANACVYGYVPNATTGTTFLYGTETVTRAQLVSILQNSIEYNDGAFMNGYEGVDGLELWDSIDIDKAFSQLSSTRNYNFDCIKRCAGSDGIMYDQPVSKSNEEVTAAYYMFDFEQQLPLGMEFSGNFGVRYVKSSVQGSGFVGLTSIRKNANWVDTNPAANITTTTITKPINIDRSYTDWLPSYNAALWVIPDKLVARYNWSKTVARPPIGRLWPAGTCTVDERVEDRVDAGAEEDMTCTTFGNPELQPYTATKNNTSIEWYPNKDTFVSLAYYRQKVKIGAPVVVRVVDVPLFAGTDEIDPATGRPISDFTFAYNTYINGPGYVMSGWELATKTALTFLPWRLRYTGVDFNISTNKASGAGGYTDPLTGQNVGVTGRPNYYANLVLWYDDGKTNVRVAYQARDEVLNFVSGNGSVSANSNSTSFPTNIENYSVNNFPILNPINGVRLPYNPGEPVYAQKYGYLDAKLTHKLSPSVEIYVEGRNLLNEGAVSIGSADRGFSDGTVNAWSTVYAGRRMTFGMTYRLQ